MQAQGSALSAENTVLLEQQPPQKETSLCMMNAQGSISWEAIHWYEMEQTCSTYVASGGPLQE